MAENVEQEAFRAAQEHTNQIQTCNVLQNIHRFISHGLLQQRMPQSPYLNEVGCHLTRI